MLDIWLALKDTAIHTYINTKLDYMQQWVGPKNSLVKLL